MKQLLTACFLSLLAAPALPQFAVEYSVYASPDQVVPAPGVPLPSKLIGSLTIATTGSGPSLSFFGTSLAIPDITEVALRGPASATSTGPVLVTIPFFQQNNSGQATSAIIAFPISTATRDVISSGQAYIEVRSVAFPLGIVRGAVAMNESLCLPQAPVSPTCGQCPCGNAPLVETGGGCINSQGGSAVLRAAGVPALSSDSLQFGVVGASSNSVALLISGTNLLPLSTPGCPQGSGIAAGLTDGMRCVGGQIVRHGVRPTGADGATTSGAFTPPGGILAQSGFMAGQSRAFQAFYRDAANSPCGTGLNTTNAVLLSFVL